ncbi:MAG: tyrosine-type recombinase/integrase [Ilumatobacteraceae bacterium]
MAARHVQVSVTLDQVTAAWLAGYTSANTRAAYRGDLRAYLAWCANEAHQPFAATSRQMRDYRDDRESSGVSTATIARQFAALRAFYATAHELHACSSNPFDSRPAAVVTRSATMVMTAAEVERLYTAAREDSRCAVLVGLLLGDGLRLSEALAIDHEDISGPVRARQLHVRRHGRTTTVALSTSTSNAIARLQRTTTDGGPLLLALPHGAARPQRLTRFGADFLLKQAAQAAGIRLPVSANVLRRTHVTMASDAGEHIDDIRDRMGHRDVRTTRRFLAPAPSQSSAT